MTKRRVFLILCLALAFSLAFGCCTMRPAEAEASPTPEASPETTPEASPETTQEPTATPQASPETTPEATEGPAVYTNPLTGEATSTDYSGQRPVAVMVENNRIIGGPVIPMFGINEADILYEMEVEKITRCMAVYMDISDVGQICPVRSARTYFVSAALAYDAIYVHRGYSAEGLDRADYMLAEYFTSDNVDLGEGNSYNIDSYPNTGEHSMCTSGELLTEYFETAGVQTQHADGSWDYGLLFTEDAAPTDGQTANTVRIVFPEMKITSFTYSADQGGYIGNNWDQEWTDGNTGTAGAFQNVLVLDSPTQIGIDAKWHSSIVTYDHEGTGYFCNGGYCEPITWSRGGLDEPFRYYRQDGSELELGVGRTYVAFISTAYGGVTFG